MPLERDPVSILWDTAARSLLSRAQQAPDEWHGTRVADPTTRQTAALRAQGINPAGRDNPSARGGRAHDGHGLNARTRWVRGFVRAVYYANRREHDGPGLHVEIEVGAHKPASGKIPAGYAVRIKVHSHVTRGHPLAWEDPTDEDSRSSDPALRDWGSHVSYAT